MRNELQSKMKSCLLITCLSLLLNCNFAFSEKKASIKKQPIFSDITQSSGINFVHFNGMTGEFFFPEMTGSGGALFDFDNDGDLDIYLVQGSFLGDKKNMKEVLFPINERPADRLLRNNLISGSTKNEQATFTDITDEAQLNIDDYGMGVATGDFNNDGWIDLIVTNYGKNRLLENKGDGTFKDLSHALPNNDQRWSTSAAFFDFNRDGLLDIYITNYVEYDVKNKKNCYARSSRLDYCGPAAFKPQKDSFYQNLGKGKFIDVTDSLLRDYQAGPGLGVTTADFNGDGWIDIYVANDGQANQLWINKSGKYFEDDGLFSGTSVNSDGKAEASMGVDAADYDNDGDNDLFMTHLMGETNTLYRNDGTGIFEDVTKEAGLGLASLSYTAFGTAWIDYDNDSFLDLLVLNGAVSTIEKQLENKDPYPLRQANQLFKNIKGKSFVEIRDETITSLRVQHVSRGASFGDIDNDGDTDVLIYNNNGPLRLLENKLGQEKPWIGFNLREKKSKRDSYGAQVELKTKDKRSLWRRVRSDGSYCSANDPRILFGLDGFSDIESIDVHWPDGSKQTISNFKLNEYNLIVKQ